MFDRYVFRVAAGLISAFTLIMVLLYGFEENVYLSCEEYPVGGACVNPLYGTCDEWYCEQEYIPAGTTLGTPPGLLYRVFSLFAGVTLLGALIVNHFMYNEKEVRW